MCDLILIHQHAHRDHSLLQDALTMTMVLLMVADDGCDASDDDSDDSDSDGDDDSG